MELETVKAWALRATARYWAEYHDIRVIMAWSADAARDRAINDTAEDGCKPEWCLIIKALMTAAL